MTSVFDKWPNFLCKIDYVMKQVPTHLLVLCHKIQFFLKASLIDISKVKGGKMDIFYSNLYSESIH